MKTDAAASASANKVLRVKGCIRKNFQMYKKRTELKIVIAIKFAQAGP